MIYCFLLAVLFLGVAVFIVHSAYRKRVQRGRQDVAIEVFGTKINATGFLAAAIAVALAFGLLSYRTLAACNSGDDHGAAEAVAVARAACRDAEAAEASKYAPESWGELDAMEARLDEAVKREQARLPFVRDWADLLNDARKLLRLAKSTRQEAVNGKRRAFSDANATIQEAQTTVEGARLILDELSACERQPKDFRKDLEAMRAMLDGYAAQVPGLESAVATEDYFGCISAARSLIESVRTLSADVTAAMEKIRCV